MTSMAVSGISALAWGIGFVVVDSIPVWFGEKVTDATNPTLIAQFRHEWLGRLVM